MEERIFIFVYWGTKVHRKKADAQNVVKIALFEIIEEVYNMGKSGFIFTTYASEEEISELIPCLNAPYILVDITDSSDSGKLKGFFPNLNLGFFLNKTKFTDDESQLDFILEKINDKGMKALSNKEKKFLKNFSQD